MADLALTTPDGRTSRRRLCLLRHATSMPATAHHEDADRTRDLSDAGRAEAQAMRRHVAALNLPPDTMIRASDAARTRQTAQALFGETALPTALDPALYHADHEALLDIVRAEPDDPSMLVIVGHNPGLYHLVLHLAGHDLDLPAFSSLLQGFAPATLAVFDVAGEWAGLTPGRATLIAVLRP